MSLATRCTACGTIFRVVQDQLKVSEGWVRCGRCQQVFSALEGLFDLEREAPPQRPPPPAMSATEVAARGLGEFVASQLPKPPAEEPVPATREDDAIESRFLAPRSEPAADEGDPDFVDARFPSELPLDSVIDEPVEPPAEVSPPITAATPPEPPPRRPLLQRWRERRDAREAAATSLLDLPPASTVVAEGSDAAAAEAEDAPPDDVLVAAATASPATPGFVRQAEDAARWQRPRVRASLVVAALLLSGLLAAQLGLQFRDTLAARQPGLQPALEALCDLAGCQIGPPRQLAALTVESSGLTRSEFDGAYRLSVVLLNRSAVAVAPPSVELSLTDPSGALIARRALAPSDFHLAVSDTAVGAEPLAAGRETAWQARLGTGGVRVSGYTVELFYP
jgi:predicted Zn finger-like uncharacterized protein